MTSLDKRAQAEVEAGESTHEIGGAWDEDRPPESVYYTDPELIDGADPKPRKPEPMRGESPPYQLMRVGELLAACAPTQYVVDGFLERNVAAGFVAPPESGKSLLAMNISACVAARRDFHGRATSGGLVVYLLGEGQHGAARRFQALERRYELGLAGAPLVVAKTRAALIDPCELARVHDAIRKAESEFGEKLTLLVVDTLSRFIAPGDESKAQDMGAYLDAVDMLRGEATSITLHHPGHGDPVRGRGSSNWRGGLDAEFSISSAAEIVTVTCQKMKDGEKPAPFSFRIEQVPSMIANPDGYPVMSVVLAPTKEAAPVQVRATGKNQKVLLAHLERLAAIDPLAIWTEKQLREIARDSAGMHRNSARDAVMGLRALGYLTDTVGGTRLTPGTGKGPKDRKMTESTVSVADKGPKKRPEAPVSLETVPSVISAGPRVQ
jgi:hypothetical protein